MKTNLLLLALLLYLSGRAQNIDYTGSWAVNTVQMEIFSGDCYDVLTIKKDGQYTLQNECYDDGNDPILETGNWKQSGNAIFFFNRKMKTNIELLDTKEDLKLIGKRKNPKTIEFYYNGKIIELYKLIDEPIQTILFNGTGQLDTLIQLPSQSCNIDLCYLFYKEADSLSVFLPKDNLMHSTPMESTKIEKCIPINGIGSENIRILLVPSIDDSKWRLKVRIKQNKINESFKQIRRENSKN
ncbi:MAG: hypothetical protein LCH37_07540 [Bacteroidetes bacterium]|nr:hypothetical protein [Bacteroidota bacterium]